MPRRRVTPEEATAAAVAIRDAADAVLAADAARSAGIRELATMSGQALPSLPAALAAVASYRRGQAAVDDALALLYAAMHSGGVARRPLARAAGIAVGTLDTRIAASPAASALMHGGGAA